MGMTSSLFRAAALLLSLMSASVAIQVDSVKTDLKPLIRAASENRVQFAVHVPHRLSLAKDGQWTNFPARARSEWRYAIRIPPQCRCPSTRVRFICRHTLTLRYAAHARPSSINPRIYARVIYGVAYSRVTRSNSRSACRVPKEAAPNWKSRGSKPGIELWGQASRTILTFSN